MKQYYCIEVCRTWHEGRVCPDCGVPSGAGANKHLYTASVNNQLYRQAEASEKQKNMENASLAGGPPMPWASELAAEYRRNGTLDVAAQTLAGT